jgi:hypothetical protein
MKKQKDPEELLKEIEFSPGEQVKRAVMNRYAVSYGTGAPGKKFWQKRIPLYQAAAAAVLLAMLSAFGGGWLFSPGGSRSLPVSAGKDFKIDMPEIEPVLAVNEKFSVGIDD